MTVGAGARAALPSGPRRRGASKQANWRRDKDAPTAVIALELDALDPRARMRVERMFAASFRLRRAMQDTARGRVDAYWAAHRLRGQGTAGAKATREQFGLNRAAVEAAAYRHLDDSVWMRDHVTKALAMHLADEVWEACDRHLFANASGKRHGRPKVGRWFDFTRIPGRARSHTKKRTWETFRLVGALTAHADTYRPSTAAAAPGSALNHPHVLPSPVKPRDGWWTYDGPLAVVFTGQRAGDLVLPVRLPQGTGQWARVEHFLADPSVWHKIDLVRVQDAAAPGGWRYYAHLMVLKAGWTSPARAARRAAVPAGRLAGIDANVSNLAIVSFTLGPRGTVGPARVSRTPAAARRTRKIERTVVQPLALHDLRAEHVTVTAAQRAAAARAAHQAGLRARAMERSRRSANPDQYEPSPGQAARAQRRATAGLPARAVQLPKGPRVANVLGVPKQAYRRDVLTDAYRRTRARHTRASRGQVRARDARARDVAARIVAAHGAALVIEDLSMTAWSRRWGKAMALFAPGRLIAALQAEARACGGGLIRASTRATALSQMCVCGHRVKKPLGQRVHRCVQPGCGLVGDRDLVSAAMAACVALSTPTDPASARIDFDLADALGRLLAGQQEALARSTTPHLPMPRTGRATVNVAANPKGLASAGHVGDPCETPDETPPAGTTRDHAADEHPLVTSPPLSHAPLRLSS